MAFDEKGCILDLLLGRSVKSIARNRRTSESAVRRVMREYVEDKLDPELRRNTMALDLGRIDRLWEICYTKALTGDLKAVDLCDRLIMRRAMALGLTAPRESLITIVEKQAPRQTSTDRIEAALRQFQDQRSPAERAAELRKQLAELESALGQQPPPEPPPGLAMAGTVR